MLQHSGSLRQLAITIIPSEEEPRMPGAAAVDALAAALRARNKDTLQQSLKFDLRREHPAEPEAPSPSAEQADLDRALRELQELCESRRRSMMGRHG